MQQIGQFRNLGKVLAAGFTPFLRLLEFLVIDEETKKIAIITT
jgi:hypothetical protein